MEDQEEIPSKSAVKREMTALQKLGESLVDLNNDQLDKMKLPDFLLDAVLKAKTISARGGRKRQLQYIGKMMRSVEDTDAIDRAVRAIHQEGHDDNARFRLTEIWRDRLIKDGDDALSELLQEYPDADRGQIRQLVRNANKEATKDKPPKSARALFKLLRNTI